MYSLYTQFVLPNSDNYFSLRGNSQKATRKAVWEYSGYSVGQRE